MSTLPHLAYALRIVLTTLTNVAPMAGAWGMLADSRALSAEGRTDGAPSRRSIWHVPATRRRLGPRHGNHPPLRSGGLLPEAAQAGTTYLSTSSSR